MSLFNTLLRRLRPPCRSGLTAGLTIVLTGVGAPALRAQAPAECAVGACPLRVEVGLLGGGRIVRTADGATVARFAPWHADGTAQVADALRAVPTAAADLRLFRANWAPGWWAGTAGLALTFAGAYADPRRLGQRAAVPVTAGGALLAGYGLLRELRGRRALTRAVAHHNATLRR